MRIFFKVDKKRRRGRHKKRRSHDWHHIQEWVWPSIGWAAFARFIEIRLKRSRGSAHNIALGFGIGVFVSFLPFVGLHSPLTLLICFLLRANFVVGIIGTFVGNPWTFPFIWIWIFKFGNFILQIDDPVMLPQTLSLEDIYQNFDHYLDHIIWPMTVGGTPTGLLAGFLSYALIRVNVASYRRARAAHLRKKRRKMLTFMKKKPVKFSVKMIKPAQVKKRFQRKKPEDTQE